MSSSETLAVVLFQVGARRCALPVAAVRGVVFPRPLDGETGAPGGPVLGVVRDGEAVIPVIDARRWMGVAPATPPAMRSRWIVLRRDGRRLALAVDGVERVCAAAVADDVPLVEGDRVSRYFTLPGALCAEPDLGALFALSRGPT
ncbi:MAG: chemotaxis protein CheW [Deltaproteobacteria bacterium]|nr:chemotaxis protein CheW [Myxococcales bacterium]MDP3218879.1 chemotaxis protein CheW [Deltaproteobacteria bacterium]